MAYDEALAEILRRDLAQLAGVSERRMFGGLAFLLDGNLLCAAEADGAMYRVGAENAEFALAVPGVHPFPQDGPPRVGVVEMTPEAAADPTSRGRVLALALDFVATLPAK